MKKRHILAALLASVCVATGAAGLAACTGGGGGDSRDPALNAIYQQYVETTENPKSYEEWVADLFGKLASDGAQGEQGPQGPSGDDGRDGIDGLDGVGIEDVRMVEVDGKQYFEFVFSNGKIVRLAVDGSDRQETSSFTIYAVDQNGDPVANAYFNIGYYNSSNYDNCYFTEDGTIVPNSSLQDAYAIKTNSKGIATFYTFLPEDDDTAYRAYVADPSTISSSGTIGGVPDGYTTNFGYSDTLFIKEGNNYSITLNFTLSNGWGALYDSTNDLIYNRYIADPDNREKITEDYVPYVKRASKGRYNYFTFSPFKMVSPSGDDVSSETIDELVALARTTASGVYRIRWSANNSGAKVSLYLYGFNGGIYFTSNSDGSPADTFTNVKMHSGSVPSDQTVLQETFNLSGESDYSTWLASYAATFSGGNYVDIEVTEDMASVGYCLGFVADTTCDVTITVERIGDVPHWTSEYVEAPVPTLANEANVEGRIIDVPLNSSIVRDNDGYYHVGSITGPVIYVQLNGGTRVNDNSMVYLSDYTVIYEGIAPLEHQSVFRNYVTETFDQATNSGVRTYTDYTKVVQEYGRKANSDGLYKVDDTIKFILENYCKSLFDWPLYDEYWVAACYYYGPVSNGTEAAPYDLTAGANTVTLNGSNATYVAFRATAAGYYAISSANGQLTVPNGLEINGTYYVEIGNLEEIVFTVSGSGTANVNIATIASTRIIEYTYATGNDKGTDANPVLISGTGVCQVNINHSVSSDAAIAVNLTAMLGGDGEYVITIYGSSTAQVLDGDLSDINGKTITISSSSPTRIWLDDIGNGTFFISITRVS